MKKTFKYRIDPNSAQRKALSQIFWFCRFLYNSALQERISHYKTFGKGISYNKQAASLPFIKEIFQEETSIIHSQVLQQTLKQLDTAYKNFFRRVKLGEVAAGFPRFKCINRFRSICFPQPSHDLSGKCIKLLTNKKLYVSGLPGELYVNWHRPLQGRCKQVKISKHADKYYILFSCDEVPNNILPSTGKTVAIDLGLNSFITTDDGTKFHHPKPYKLSKDRLAFLQHKRSKKKLGSNNYKRTILSLQRAFEKVSNIRKDFQHKLAKQLVEENDTIILEKLNIKDMLEAKGFEINKNNISDASWAQFISILKYKAENAGREVIEVDPRNTSKTCSNCNNIKYDLELKDREYDCNACGTAMDRDINAALNIRRLGINLAKEN